MHKAYLFGGAALGVIALMGMEKQPTVVTEYDRKPEPPTDAQLEAKAKHFAQAKNAEAMVWHKAWDKRKRRQERNLRHVGNHSA